MYKALPVCYVFYQKKGTYFINYQKKTCMNEKVSIFALRKQRGNEVKYLCNSLFFMERCQSGRMGRSRKPLTSLLVPGFESLSLR